VLKATPSPPWITVVKVVRICLMKERRSRGIPMRSNVRRRASWGGESNAWYRSMNNKRGLSGASSICWSNKFVAIWVDFFRKAPN
jgi:hypothetical protein